MTTRIKPEFEPHMTMGELCQWLHVSRFSVYAWIKNLGMPVHRTPGMVDGKGRLLFLKSEVQNWWDNLPYNREETEDEKGTNN